MTQTAFQVKTEVYEGPFDLLLQAIDEGKLNVQQVSLMQITSTYFDYLKQFTTLNLVSASEFLLMAAYLIELKSKLLLPISEAMVSFEEEELISDVEKTLADRLEEYKVFKNLAQSLGERRKLFNQVYTRSHVDDPRFVENKEIFLTDVSLRDLVLAFKQVWEEVASREEVKEIQDDIVTLPDKIEEVKRLIKGKTNGIEFTALFIRKTKLEIVVTFLAILELARQKLIQIKQGERFGSIVIQGIA